MVQVQFENAEYKNLSFNPLVGSVQFTAVIFPEVTREIGFSVDVNIRDPDGAIIKQLDRTNHTFNPANGNNDIRVSKSTTFSIEAGETFPASAEILIIVRGNIVGNFPFSIPFTGTQPTGTPPQLGMVEALILPQTFNETRFDVDMIATKTNTFPPEFNFDGMKYVFNLTRVDNGQVLKAGELPFVFGNEDSHTQPLIFSDIPLTNVFLTIAVWNDSNVALSESTSLELGTPSPPPPPFFDVVITAENGQTLLCTITEISFNFWSSPDFGAGSLNGSITGTPSTSTIADCTDTEINDFLFNNLVGTPPPPPPPPPTDNNVSFSVVFDNGSPEIPLYVLTALDLEVAKVSFAGTCATITNEFSTPEPPQDLFVLLEQVEAVCSGSPPPPPPPIGDNINFHVVYDNGSPKKVYTLTPEDLTTLKASIVGTCARVEDEFNTPEPPQLLDPLIQEINIICSMPPLPPPPPNGEKNLGGKIVAGAVGVGIAYWLFGGLIPKDEKKKKTTKRNKTKNEV